MLIIVYQAPMVEITSRFSLWLASSMLADIGVERQYWYKMMINDGQGTEHTVKKRRNTSRVKVMLEKSISFTLRKIASSWSSLFIAGFNTFNRL